MSEKLYIDLLLECIIGGIYDGEYDLKSKKKPTLDNIELGAYWPAYAHSMIGRNRMKNVLFCIEQCLKNNIEGDLIETGVWRGGTTIFMRGVLKAYGIENRKVYVADSFEGLPKPDNKYPADKNDIHHTYTQLAINLETVKSNFTKYKLLDDKVIFIKGFFEESLKNTNIEKLAVLRLDGDMYSSTIQVLDYLYDKVSKGGYIIVDDWKLQGCNKAVLDFRNKRNITDKIITLPGHGAYWKKS